MSASNTKQLLPPTKTPCQPLLPLATAALCMDPNIQMHPLPSSHSLTQRWTADKGPHPSQLQAAELAPSTIILTASQPLTAHQNLDLRPSLSQAAALAPSIIFLDELDALAPARAQRCGGTDQIYASVVSTLLALMDGLEDRGQVIVVGVTNRWAGGGLCT